MTADDAARLTRLVVELRRLQRGPDVAAAESAGGATSGTGAADDCGSTAVLASPPMSHREILGYIAEHPGTRTSDIAEALRLAPNTISGVVSALVEGGYVSRRQNPKDRRSVTLRLTAEASELLRGRRERHLETVHLALERLSADERDAIRAALPALEALRDTLRDDLTTTRHRARPTGRPALAGRE